ncbi:uncharacterized protein APUU_60400A [Aspergillus puulaauensis]|uniref:DNA2/NAM7 helicase helicase domain-containing protein n=1 Tax=Aspergillus puulaauensis TaxID=1220207 RepID=A0A7R7XTC0_9EURO|nr:uncharacterized protein APUU_60400A [Aspergillus puulaauensis]BCS27352.1 hypothetical protein APUU_60400A [Aspergillus puulaauensis]
MEEFLTPTDITISKPNNSPDEWSTHVEENPVEPDGVIQDTNTTEPGYDWREADVALMSEIPSGPTDSMVEGCVFNTDKELIEFSPSQLAAADSYKPTLIALADKKSDAVKDLCGTQWRNAQFCWIRGKDPRDNRLLPAIWAVKKNGVNVRARVRGGNVARELAIEFSVYHQGEPVHRATLEFDACAKKGKNKRAARSYDDEGDADNADSYVVMQFTTEGGVSYGLDYDESFLTADDRMVLSYARLLSMNFRPSPEQRLPPTTVCLRIHASHVSYDGPAAQNSHAHRLADRNDRVQNLVFSLHQDANGEPWTGKMFWAYCSGQGRLQTQWGELVGRDAVAERCGGLVAFPAKSSFSCLDHARITLVYATCLEHTREEEIAAAISSSRHRIAFVISQNQVLGLARFNIPESAGVEYWAPREGTKLKLSYHAPGTMSTRNTVCTAICTPNIYSLPYSGVTLFYLPRANPLYYLKYAVNVGERPRYLFANALIEIPRNGAQRQVSAINRLCAEPHLMRFSEYLLNQKVEARRPVNPLAPLQSDEAEALNVIKETLSIQEWSDSQAKCIESMNSFPGLFLLIQGYPGTGKTSTIVAMASIYVTCGGHVLFTAPSHDSADAICETIEKWNAVGNTNNVSYVRVYRQISETKAFRRHGKVYEEFREQECAKAPGVRSVVANVVKWSLSNVLGRVVSLFAKDPIPTPEEVAEPAVEEEPEYTPAATQEYADADAGFIDEDEGFVPQTIPLADQLAMSGFLKELKKHNATKGYCMPDQSLEAHVFRLAYTEGRTVMANFPTEEQIEAANTRFWVDSVENGEIIPDGPPVDMLAVLRLYADMLKEYAFGRLEEGFASQALLAFKRVCKAVIREATTIVCTNNTAGNALIYSNFG